MKKLLFFIIILAIANASVEDKLCNLQYKDYTLALGLSIFIAVLYYAIMFTYSRIIKGDRNVEVINAAYIRETFMLLVIYFAFILALDFFINYKFDFLNLIMSSSGFPYNTQIHYFNNTCIRQNAYQYLKAAFLFGSAVLERLEMLDAWTTFFSNVKFVNTREDPLYFYSGGVKMQTPAEFGVDVAHNTIRGALSNTVTALIFLSTQIIMLIMFSSSTFYKAIIIAFILRFFPLTKTLGNIMLATFISLYFIYPFVLYFEGYAFPVKVPQYALTNAQMMKQYVNNELFFNNSIFKEDFLKLSKNDVRNKYTKFANVFSFNELRYIQEGYNRSQKDFCLYSINKKIVNLNFFRELWNMIKGDNSTLNSSSGESLLFCLKPIKEVSFDVFIISFFTLSLNLVIMIVAIKTISGLIGDADTMIDLFMKVV